MNFWDRFRLDGRRAVVTGASRGLGREMALALAEAGADILITGRSMDTLEATAVDIKKFGGNIRILAADMGDPQACEVAFQEIIEVFGPVDILVNNVGGRTGPQPTQELILEQWQTSIDPNLTSCFLGTKLIGAAMIKDGRPGSIINISSMNAMIANQGIGGRSYETAKAGIVQFSRATAADWAPQGVRVNVICPGLFMTDANRKWNETKPEVIDNLVGQTPLGRAGEPREIGPLVVFLASDASSYVTGASHVIDGGYTLW